MGNELEKIIANQLPEAGKISQHANKLYNINHVEHITITPCLLYTSDAADE